MAKSWTFRITREGLKELESDLRNLGVGGERVFDKLKQAAPGLADGLRGAELQLGKTKDRLTQVAKESSSTGKALRAADQEAEAFASGFAARLGPIGNVLGFIGPKSLIAAAGVGVLTSAFVKAVEAAEAVERSQRKLDAVLRATGNSAGLTSQQIAGVAEKMQSDTLFGSTQILEASARLATFRSISGDTFKRVIRDAADLATVFDGDLNGAVLRLGKALEDPIAGYDDLAKSGVRLSAAQRDVITNFVKGGELAKAQDVILGELEKRVGGAAAGDQSGLTGSLNQLSDAWGTFWETAGSRIEESGVLSIIDTISRGVVGLASDLRGPSLAQQIDTLQQQLASKWKEFGDIRASGSGVPTGFGGITVVNPTNTAAVERDIESINGKISALQRLQQQQELNRSIEEEAAKQSAALAQKQAADALAAAAVADELKRQATERATASKNFDEFLIKLKTERDTLGMSNIERDKYNANLEVEKALKDKLHSVDANRIAQARELIQITAESAEQWESTLSFMDMLAKQQKRDEESAKSLAKGQSDVLKDQQKQAEKQAESLQRPFDNAAENIQRTFADVFADVFRNGVDSFDQLGDAAVTIFTRLAGELAALLIFQPQLLGGGMSAPSSGVGVGSGATGAQSLTGGFNLSNLLSPSSYAGSQWNTGFGTALFGQPAVTGPYGSTIGTSSTGLFGSSGGGQLGSMLNSPLGGGAAAGLLAAGATAAAGGSVGESVGAGVGGAIGGIAGSYFGPVGTMIGSTVGSMLGKMLGGLFNKKEKYKKVKAVSGAALGFDEYGMLDVDGTFASAKGKGLKVDASAGGKLGDMFAGAFNDFFLGLGADFDPSANAQVQQVYHARVKGKKKKGEKNYFYGSFAGENIGTANSAEELLPMFLSGSLAVAAEKGLVKGISETIQQIFKTVFNENGRQGVSDPDELTRMVEFGKFYDRVDQIRSPAQAAAEALSELEKNLRSARSTADEFGLSVEHIDDVFKQNFDDDVAGELLSLKDPEAYALEQLDKEYAARVAVAERLGADLAQVEELYALKRQQIVEQGLSSVGSSFRSFFDDLVYGDQSAVSPDLQLATAKANYDQTVASGDKSGFRAAAEQYLSLMRDAYASTEPYVAAFKDVLKNTIELGGLDGAASAGRFGDDMLAHINSNEAALLKALGGAGTINPTTGLLEFYEAGRGGGGAKGGQGGAGAADGKGGGSNARDKAMGGKDKKSSGSKSPPKNPAINPGNPNLGLSGPNYSGAQGPNTGVDPAHPDPASSHVRDGSVGGGGWDRDFGEAPTSPMSADGFFDGSKANTKNGPTDIDKFMQDWADYQGLAFGDMPADTFWDTFWNGIGSLLGFNEKNPVVDPDYNAVGGSPPGSGANWGWDPAGLLGSIIGGAAGFPFGGGLIASMISELLGRPLEVNMGSSVMGGAADMAGLGTEPMGVSAANLGLDGAGAIGDVGGPLADKSMTSAFDGTGIERLERLSALQQTGSRQTFQSGGGNAQVSRGLEAVRGEIAAMRRESKAGFAALSSAIEMNNYTERYNRGGRK